MPVAVLPLLLLVVVCAPTGARADIGDRNTVLVPQLIFPMGDLSEVAATGAGIGVEYNRPLDPELTLVATIGSLGFRRRTNADALLSLTGLLAVSDDRQVTTRYEVVAVPFLVGVKYSAPDYFVGLSVGDLFTRVEQTTLLRTGLTERVAGQSSRSRHGPLLSASIGLERRNVSFTGLRLGFAPGKRGPDGASNFSWITLFVSL